MKHSDIAFRKTVGKFGTTSDRNAVKKETSIKDNVVTNPLFRPQVPHSVLVKVPKLSKTGIRSRTKLIE